MSKAREQGMVSVFSALGDGTRLSLVKKLGRGRGLSATALSNGAEVSRQAIVKHLRVLEGAGVVTHERRGREVLYALKPRRLRDARAFLDNVSARWDRALERLRQIVEEPQSGSGEPAKEDAP